MLGRGGPTLAVTAGAFVVSPDTNHSQGSCKWSGGSRVAVHSMLVACQVALSPFVFLNMPFVLLIS